jgi:hypothetical protein
MKRSLIHCYLSKNISLILVDDLYRRDSRSSRVVSFILSTSTNSGHAYATYTSAPREDTCINLSSPHILILIAASGDTASTIDETITEMTTMCLQSPLYHYL